MLFLLTKVFLGLQFYCAPPPSTTQDPSDSSANIDMTTIRPLKIEVNEKELFAWVSAGVIVWDLMVYLGNYVTPAAPRGRQARRFQKNAWDAVQAML